MDRKVLQALQRSWRKETALHGKGKDGSPENQCLVTAMVIQDWFGGYILTNNIKGKRHYWNLLDGKEIDYTQDQFDDGVNPWYGKGVKLHRSQFDNNPQVKSRYVILRELFSKNMR